jgi:predicted tellurium resistance membrane protein TerC
MENLAANNETGLQAVTAMLALAFFFAPVLVAYSKRGGTLKFTAVLLCILGFVGTPLIIATIPIIGMAIAPVFFGTVWLAAMICGAASFIATATQRHASEATYRILQNDIVGVPVPDSVEKPTRRDARL